MKDYQLIRIGEVWHLTQQQARPPARAEMACHTSCGKWAEMKDGFERGRPSCRVCLLHVERYETGKDAMPRLCSGCRSLDGEHDFGETCTLATPTREAVDEVNARMVGPVSLRDRVQLFEEAFGAARRRRASL